MIKGGISYEAIKLSATSSHPYPIPLFVRETLTVDQVKHRIASIDLLVVAGWDVHSI